MRSLTGFYLNCPFYPPNSILNAVLASPSLRSLSINDTPLYLSMIPNVPPAFHLERLSLVPVAEAVRVGEGPYDARYSEATYYLREYRKKYRNDVLARLAAISFISQVGKTTSLKHVEVSGDLCTLDALAAHEWPHLHTLILTGHAPRPQGENELLDVLARMPSLREMRLLFAKSKGDQLGFRVVPPRGGTTARGNSPALLRQIRYLALSNACNLEGVFHYTTSMERLAISAITDQPRVPVALGRAEIDMILRDIVMGGGSQCLRHLRIMIEDKVNPDLCRAIGIHCPRLEILEIELCGYHDGKSIHAWVSEFFTI